MKTLETIKKLLAEYIEEGTKELTKKEAKVIEKQIKHLYICQLYLETSPTEEFLSKQQEDVTRKIKAINAGFSKWCSANPKERDSVANPKSKYHSLMGMKNFKAQLSTLNYLLH